MTKTGISLALLAGLTVLAAMSPARADVTADTLLNVLVRKGVPTQDKANQMKAEAVKEAETAKSEAKDPTAAADAMAWYAMYLRPVSAKTLVGLRYDQWDPDTHDTND